MLPPRQPPGHLPLGKPLMGNPASRCGCPAGVHTPGCWALGHLPPASTASGPPVPQHGPPKQPRDCNHKPLPVGTAVRVLHNHMMAMVTEEHPHHLRPEVTVQPMGVFDPATQQLVYHPKHRYAGTMLEKLPDENFR